MKDVMNIVLGGVGGQGTLVAGKLLGIVALKMGWDIKVSEVHGMSQRGGSVITYVRMGKKVYSPIIEKGMADYILAFEELEALRWAPLLAENGTLIMNQQRIIPVTVKIGNGVYPDHILKELKEAGKSGTTVVELDAESLAKESGSIRSVNMVMLGAMSRYASIPDSVWLDAICEVFPESLQTMNRTAFQKGKES